MHADRTDDLLVVMTRDGDLSAFDELVRRHCNAVYRQARAVVGNHEDAQDIVQEVFTAAWRGLPAFRQNASFASWLHTITTRRTLNALTRRPPPAARLTDDGVLQVGAGPLEMVETRERADWLTAAVRGLPEPQRTMITLYADHVAYRDIAVQTGTTLPAVRSHLHRARRTLRTVLRSAH